MEKAEERASSTVEWLLDNGMVLSLNKSMFIVQASRELWRTRDIHANLNISVQGKELPCLQSTKLLEFILNQDDTWENHLWGYRDEEVKLPGLICALNRAVGVIKKLATILPPRQLRMVALGFFNPGWCMGCH